MVEKIDLENTLKKRPFLFFGDSEPSPEIISSEISQGAKTLGAQNVNIIRSGDWSFVVSDKDWFYLGKFPDKSESIFEAPWGFPEMGQNCCRYEVMSRIYSCQTITWQKGEIETIKGEPLTASMLTELLAGYEKYERGIGFRFKPL